ncbi:arginine--tRNA ligase [Myxococcota bacterium]|nr:arginine--tRNA ligase [Myxococcota bacterium]
MPSPLARFRHALAAAVVRTQGLAPEQVEQLERQIRVPEPGRGDLALPCFSFAKLVKQNPPEVARQVADALSREGLWAKVEAVGPYVNVTFDTHELATTVVPLARSATYGTSDAGHGKTVVIDFSSPNIAKPLAFHHIRSTVIGAALARLHAANGWTVVGINYLGDWGKQFGLLATGFLRYGDPAKRSDAKHLVEVYVKANREADVAKRKEAIERPAQVKQLADQLEGYRAELASAAEPAVKKKLEKTVKNLEKKLRELRGFEDGEDPTTSLDTWMEELVEKAKIAADELPLAEERDREARLFFKRLEEGEATAIAEWREFRETSIREFQRVYARMGVEFTSIEGESLYTDVLEATVEKVRERPGTRISDGAEIVDMPYKDGEPPVLLKTRDGTTLYVTRDVAAAIDRHARFAFERSLYVVSADQSLHFSQLFRTLEAMGHAWAKKCAHVAFGRVHGMSTRRGEVVFLDEVLEESVAKAREICEASEKIDRARLDETVEAIGVGSIVFGDLKNLRTTDYTFDREQVLKFDGETAPYVQFSHARTCSIIKKAGGVPADADLTKLVLDEERAVLSTLAAYPDVVAQACDTFEPSLVTRALVELAGATASWLTAGNRDRSKMVNTDDAAVKAARLHLVDAVRVTLAHGLGLLGVRAPEAM